MSLEYYHVKLTNHKTQLSEDQEKKKKLKKGLELQQLLA